MNHWSHLWSFFFSEDEAAYHKIWTIIVSAHVCVHVYNTKGRRVEKRRCWTIDSCGTNIRACPNSQESHSSPPYPSGSVWVPSVTPKPNPTPLLIQIPLNPLLFSPFPLPITPPFTTAPCILIHLTQRPLWSVYFLFSISVGLLPFIFSLPFYLWFVLSSHRSLGLSLLVINFWICEDVSQFKKERKKQPLL